MYMPENRKRLNIAIPMDLYTRVTADGRTITVVIIEALELLAGMKEESVNPDHAQKEERINNLLERIEDFKDNFASARTFVFLHELKELFADGWKIESIKSVSEDNDEWKMNFAVILRQS